MANYCPPAPGPFANVNLTNGTYAISQSLNGTLLMTCALGYANTISAQQQYSVAATCNAYNSTSGQWNSAQNCFRALASTAFALLPSTCRSCQKVTTQRGAYTLIGRDFIVTTCTCTPYTDYRMYISRIHK